MEKVLKKYQERLNDISRRNRAIRLSRIIKKKTFDISDLSNIESDQPIQVVNKLFFENKSANLIDINVKNKEEERILKDILYLKRDVEFILKEKGYHECFLGYPFIQGNFSEGSFFRAPLFLVPIQIDFNRATRKVTIKPLPDSSVQINKTFFIAFNKYNKGYKNLNLEDLKKIEDLKSEELIEWSVQLFEGLNMETNINTFKKTKIDSLKPLIKDEHPKNLSGKIEFLPYAILGEFSQLNSAMNNDYDELIKDKSLSDSSKLILGENTERDLEERFDDEKLIDSPEADNYFITKPDISQEQVLIKSRTGKGLVIHGPPGTGKSQVITNLIADNLLRDKKILLVCEKRAALDVVKNRLASKGISKHCLLIHDSQNDRNQIFKQMASTLNAYDLKDDGVDGFSGEPNMKKMLEKAKSFDMGLLELKKLISLIHDKGKHGISLYSLYRHSNKEQKPILDIKGELFEKVSFNDLKTYSESISKIANQFYKYEKSDSPIYLRKRFSTKFDELEFKEKVANTIKVFENLEKTFYNKEFKSDLKLINFKRKLNIEELFNISEELKFLKDKEKNRFSRIFDSKWWSLKSKYSKIRSPEDFEKLIERWNLLEKPLKSLKDSLSFIRLLFKEEFLESIEKNFINFEKNSIIFVKIKELFGELDEIVLFDSNLEKLTNLEYKIANLCYSSIRQNLGDDMTPIWRKTIENSFFIHWINESESNDPIIRSFSDETYQSIKNKLVELINKKIEVIPEVIYESFMNKYSELKWKNYDYDGRRKNYNNLRGLVHELNKQRKRLTFRELFNVFYREGLLELFPCWMCSPETVSSIFPLKKDLFDVVIFDEASQTRLEKAIPSINRGKSLIVAGDEKQLPPSRFFMASQEEFEDEKFEDYDEQQLLENESLLERAKTTLPGKRLIYHYRSNHEELINFSNYAFYDKSLRVIPKNKVKKDTAIEYKNVRGIWDSGINLREAEEVVKKIKELLKTKEQPTLGVITFNVKQKDLIEELLDEEAAKDPLFAKLLDSERERYNQDEYTGIFVKNIENVQGDERDIIIFSISYGFDKTKKFRYMFGPLNGPYGPNRLNVAISRAREKIIIFNSFDPSELKYSGSFDGPKLLRDYLSYSKYISEGDYKRADEKLDSLNELKIDAESPEFESYDSDFEGEVRDALSKIGYKIKTQVGCKGYKIDLAVVHPKQKGKFIVGIECDGAMYHSSKSAKERDIYRQEILENSGWNILRVWSRDWWKNEDSEVKRLDREIKKLL
ncbi:MAG: AAA domain-containing protein [Nanoarchaeota archaeon]|nr:AAA domain-containing protein [Nanoarchaeota archaeon]